MLWRSLIKILNLKNFLNEFSNQPNWEKISYSFCSQYLLYNHKCWTTKQFIAHGGEKFMIQEFYKYLCAIHMLGQQMLNNNTCK